MNGRFLTQGTTGVQRYAHELVRALDARLATQAELRRQFDVRLLAPRGARPMALRCIAVDIVGRGSGQAWEQLELPRHVGNRLLLNLCNTAPLVARNVVVIHDASVYAVPEAYAWAFRTWYRMLLPALARQARGLLTVSEFSRGELARVLGVTPERIGVVGEGGEHVLRVDADERILHRLALQRGSYVLAVGSRSPHKNFAGLLDAVARLGSTTMPVVVAGGANARVFREGAAAAEIPAFRPAGYVTDAELRALYEHACGFVFPSLYEGFGLPALEAMACGCPVLAARAGALPEVCGDAALYCDPRDPGDIAAALTRLMTDASLRDELRRRGRARAADLTWDAAAADMLNLIEGLEAA